MLLPSSPSDAVGESSVLSRARGEGVTVHLFWAATAAFLFGRMLAKISSSLVRLEVRLMGRNSAAAGTRDAGDASGEGAARLASATDRCVALCGDGGGCDGRSAMVSPSCAEGLQNLKNGAFTSTKASRSSLKPFSPSRTNSYMIPKSRSGKLVDRCYCVVVFLSMVL